MSGLKPKDPPPSAKAPTVTPSQIVPTPNSSEGIVLANLTNMKNQDADPPNADKLVAMEEGEGKGMEEEENGDIFLNLENIEDVEMSIDSSKRKGVEEGEECTCHS